MPSPFFVTEEPQKGGTSGHTGAKTCLGEDVFSPWESPWIAAVEEYTTESLAVYCTTTTVLPHNRWLNRL